MLFLDIVGFSPGVRKHVDTRMVCLCFIGAAVKIDRMVSDITLFISYIPFVLSIIDQCSVSTCFFSSFLMHILRDIMRCAHSGI